MTTTLSQRMAMIALALTGLSGLFCSSALSQKQSQPNETPLHSYGTVHNDTPYQYLSRKGTVEYKAGNYNRAAKYFALALKSARSLKIEDDRLALLLTNLAATYRQQQRFIEAAGLFEEAVKIESKDAVKDKRAIDYTAQQYAALFRDTDRDLCADYILAAAKDSFKFDKNSAPSGFFLAEGDDDQDAKPQRGLFEEKSFDERSKEANELALKALVTPSVTAQLRDLAEIERMYAEQSRLASTPSMGLMDSGYGDRSGFSGFSPSFSFSTFYPPFVQAPSLITPTLQTLPLTQDHFSHGGFSHGGGRSGGGHFGR